MPNNGCLKGRGDFQQSNDKLGTLGFKSRKLYAEATSIKAKHARFAKLIE